MANQINTRIRLKYDSYANWQSKNPTLLSGEIAIAYLGPTVDTSTVTPNNNTHPVLFKVGPGAFNSLPWASALAADVYEWAKAEKAPDEIDTRYAFAVTTDGKLQVTETKYINEVAQTPNTTSYDFVTPKELEDILKNYYTKTEVDTITGKLTDLSTTSKGNLVSAINEVRQAVEVGGTGSVVTVEKEGTEYIVKQGETEVEETRIAAESLTLNAGKGLVSNANVVPGDFSSYDPSEGATAPPSELGQEHDGMFFQGANGVWYKFTFREDTDSEVSPATEAEIATIVSNVYNPFDTATELTFEHYVPTIDSTVAAAGITVDEFGHVTDVDFSNYKTKQTIKSESFSGVQVIGSYSQDENGVVTITSRDLTAAALGLESAMHFVGALSSAPASANPGDVYLNTATKKEYVYAEGQGWVELGDEGSYALKTVKIQANEGLEVTAGGTLASDTTIGIADGGVTEDKLATAVTTKLNKEWQPVGNYKTIQTAVTNPTASGKALAFIDTISQDTNGKITATKKNVNLDDYALKTEIPSIPTGSGTATIATVADDIVTLKANAVLDDHTLKNGTGTDITLAKVAKTGSIYDVEESYGDYLVFYCGTSTEIV